MPQRQTFDLLKASAVTQIQQDLEDNAAQLAADFTNTATQLKDDLVDVVADERTRRDVTALLADTDFTYTPGTPGTVTAGDVIRTRAEGFSYEVAASGATDHHVTTAGGVKLYEAGPNFTGETRLEDAIDRGFDPGEGRTVFAGSALYLRKGSGVELPGWVKRMQLSRDKIVATMGVDFDTFQDAFDHLVQVIVPTGTEIELYAPNGWDCFAGLDVRGGDYRRFIITAEDDELTLPSGFSGSFLRTRECVSPVLGCLVDMQNNGNDGINAITNTHVTIRQGMGVINAGRDGLFLNRHSDCYVEGGQSEVGAQLQGAAQRSAYFDHVCRFYGRNSNFSGAGGDANIRARTLCVLQAEGMISNDGAGHGVHLEEGARMIGGTTALRPQTVNGNAGRGYWVTKGSELVLVRSVSAHDNGRSEAKNNGEQAIRCDGGKVYAEFLNGTESGTNGVINTRGEVTFFQCDFSDNNQSGSTAGADQDCVRGERGARTVCDVVKAENAARDAFKQISGGKMVVNASSADNAVRHGYRAEFLGRIDVVQSSAAGVGGSETSIGSGGVVERVS